MSNSFPSDVFAVYDELALLEDPQNPRGRGTKPAAPFNREPLIGLWHKHYTQASYIPRNLVNHWTKRRTREMIAAVLADPTVPPERQLDRIAHAFVMDGYYDRSGAEELTGEWIVYAKHDERNYYLTLGRHGEDEAIMTRVGACREEFPELEVVL